MPFSIPCFYSSSCVNDTSVTILWRSFSKNLAHCSSLRRTFALIFNTCLSWFVCSIPVLPTQDISKFATYLIVFSAVYTHVRISQLVASVSTSCVRTSCSKLSTSLEQAIDNLWEPWRECQRCYKAVLTTLIQSCCNKIVSKLTTQDCNNIVISWLYHLVGTTM